jgi:DNA mismatch repair protein MutS2
MPSQSLVSPASARALELDSLFALVAELTATDLGREAVEALAPFTDEGALRRERRRFEEASRLVGRRPLVGALDISVRDLLGELGASQPSLGGSDLVRLGDVLRSSTEAIERIVDQEDPPAPELTALAAPLPDLSALVEAIRKTLDARGDVRESASPLLLELRGRIRTSRDRLYQELSSYVIEHRDDLSEETIPMRGGRLVLVLSSGSRGRLQGLTHGRSGSGKSFYFEPLSAVEGNNTLQQAVEDEEAERQRILRQLIRQARTSLAAIEEHAAFLGHLDRLQAAVRLGETCDGRLVELAPQGELRLEAARHPLLDPSLADLRERALGAAGHRGAIVPLDLKLSADRRALVITGPNAGGKTVALKTVGLLAAASQCALPVPVGPASRLPMLCALVATVGDEQDLLADRSTFSGRLLRLKEAWERSGPDSLILLDELGSGTDPEEGSALSVALLEGLVEHGSLTVITTHLTQVAAAALEMDGAGCAAMEFASATGEPTYRLLPGPPGGSEALALARRLGLPSAWLDRAEARLGSEHRRLNELLAEVENVRQELGRAQDRAEAHARDLARERDELARAHEELDEEKVLVGRRMKDDLERFRRETADKLRDEVARLKEELDAGRRKGLAARATERLFEVAPEPELPEPEDALPLEEGATVRHAAFGWEGRLESLDRGRAEVNVRGKTFRCTADELVAVESPEAAERKVKTSQKKAGRVRVEAASDEAPPELHLIGQRVEPALDQLDDYLDRALVASREWVRIVHGHGTGRLRRAVREHLDSHPAVASHRRGKPSEGGDGATVATLRGR